MKSLRLKLLLSFGIIIVLTLTVSLINSFIIRRLITIQKTSYQNSFQP
ncbi:hypothetical protein [Bacillus sp. S/N-304-OC-R1]|nr:hypothetical protein [Bacillus sp. S/N-304-OC-R1]MBY0121204.1 hypothetical protein [Bacillus sp. S/N-304-OC-R1]